MKGQKLFVRRAAEDDSTNIAPMLDHSCDSSLLSGARLAWISKLAGSMVGAAWESPDSSPEHIVLRTVLVETPVRRLQIGRFMLAEIERIAAESGASRISIEPTIPEGFLRRTGYRPVHHRYEKDLVSE